MLHLATHTNDVPVFSSPAFSTPANLVPRFPVRHFQSPPPWMWTITTMLFYSAMQNSSKTWQRRWQKVDKVCSWFVLCHACQLFWANKWM